MKKKYTALVRFAVIAVAASLFVCASLVKSVSAERAGFPAFELPIPGSEADKSYLGLSGSGTFTVGQIKAPVLIIEVFSFYCPHCQRSAAQINDLYQMIEKRADLKGRVKMIGIGAKNSAFEVDAYRERYQVPFPLFPDEGLEITEKLGVKGTPTFIGVMVDGKGNQERFYFGEGSFQDNKMFLTEIVRLSGISQGGNR
jgi:thiol-disulfide isomerase/thioredoxin